MKVKFKVDLLVDGEHYCTIAVEDTYEEAYDESVRLTAVGDGESFVDAETGYTMTVEISEYEDYDSVNDDEFFGDPWRDAGITIHDFI